MDIVYFFAPMLLATAAAVVLGLAMLARGVK
jgi:hypothetical protein